MFHPFQSRNLTKMCYEGAGERCFYSLLNNWNQKWKKIFAMQSINIYLRLVQYFILKEEAYCERIHFSCLENIWDCRVETMKNLLIWYFQGYSQELLSYLWQFLSEIFMFKINIKRNDDARWKLNTPFDLHVWTPPKCFNIVMLFLNVQRASMCLKTFLIKQII